MSDCNHDNIKYALVSNGEMRRTPISSK